MTEVGSDEDARYLDMATPRNVGEREADAGDGKGGGDGSSPKSPSGRMVDAAVRSAARSRSDDADMDVFSTDVYILPEAIHKSYKKANSASNTAYEDVYGDYLMTAAPNTFPHLSSPSTNRQRILFPSPPPHPPLPTSTDKDSTWCRMSKEKCSMLAIAILLFLAATAVATMFTTQAVILLSLIL